MRNNFVPDAGDVIWLDFNPQAGHEQAGHRPALVISPGSYNSKSGLLVCCPLTTKSKGFPFEVRIGDEEDSVVLADQVKSLDWQARNAKKKSTVSAEVLAETRAKLTVLIAG